MKKRNLVGIVGAVALTAAIAVTGTLAYLSFITDQKVNKFSSTSEIDGEITETEWDKVHNENGWANYLPGESTFKNPRVEINSDSVDARIAMKLVCIDNDGKEIPFNEFKEKYAKVFFEEGKDGEGEPIYAEGINKNFTQFASTGLYVYNGIVKAGEKSPELFNKVQVNTGIKRVYSTKTVSETATIKTCKVDGKGDIKVDGAGNQICTTVKGKPSTVMVEETEKVFIFDNNGETKVDDKEVKLPSFEIKVTGYAVQAAGTDDTYTQLLIDLADVVAR